MEKTTETVVAQIDQPMQKSKGCVFYNTKTYRLQKTSPILAVATDGEKVMVETENCFYQICGDNATLKKHNFKLALGYNGTVKVHGTVIDLEKGRPAMVLTKVGMMHTSPVQHLVTAPNGEVTIITHSGSQYIITGKPL
jgi:hypothetical protein